jgi:hypothetical protein
MASDVTWRRWRGRAEPFNRNHAGSGMLGSIAVIALATAAVNLEASRSTIVRCTPAVAAAGAPTNVTVALGAPIVSPA